MSGSSSVWRPIDCTSSSLRPWALEASCINAPERDSAALACSTMSMVASDNSEANSGKEQREREGTAGRSRG